MRKRLLFLLLSGWFTQSLAAAPSVDVDYQSFLRNHDMIWDRVPNRWEVAPYSVRGFSHSTTDVIYFEIVAQDGESIEIRWHPDVPFSPVRATLDAGGGPKRGGNWDAMRKAPYELPPEPTLSEQEGMQICFQPLYENRGETTTGWEITGDAAGRQPVADCRHPS